MTAAIEISGLRKSYGDREAVRGIDLSVAHGEVFAFLGPNGAGKTTTVEILEGYRERNGGTVAVLGVDPARGDREWRSRIGVVLQESEPDPFLTVAETMRLFAGYYPAPRAVQETVDHVGLAPQAGQRVRNLSGGQRRRLDVGLALIGDPELIFLDEPTTGFDPSARRNAWALIAGLRDLGKTVFLTTHYMDEAQAVADRVAIISAGEIVAEGPPGELGGRAQAPTTIRFRLPAGVEPAAIAPDGMAWTSEGSLMQISSADPVRDLNALTGRALGHGYDLEGLTVERPSLEDVYLELTGG